MADVRTVGVEFGESGATQGEVLLEKVYDDSGSLIGKITADRTTVLSMKGHGDDELERLGWLRYKAVIESAG